MAKKQKWDVNNQSALSFDEGEAPCFKLWDTEGDNTALLDADMFPYIVGFSQSQDDWNTVLLRVADRKLKVGSRKAMRFLMRQKECKRPINHCDSLVNAWAEMINADSARLFLTAGERQFRYDVAFSKLYKGNRTKPKPPFYSLVKWHLEHNHKATVCYENEADDAMSIIQYQHNKKLVKQTGYKQGHRKLKGFSCMTIVTKDKDLNMIAGWHSNPDLNDGEPYWVSELGELLPEYTDETHSTPNRMKKLGGTGLKFFYAQILMGDVVDNYSGLAGCGMTAAFKVLNELETVEDCHRIVVKMYKNKYNPYKVDKFPYKTWTGKLILVDYMDLFLEQARLAWMQTKKGDVFMKKSSFPDPSLWRV